MNPVADLKPKRTIPQALAFFGLQTLYMFLAACFLLVLEVLLKQPSGVNLDVLISPVLSATAALYAAGMMCLLLAEKNGTLSMRIIGPVLVATVGYLFPILAFLPVAWATTLEPKK